MDAIPGITVGECVGWKISSDKQTVLAWVPRHQGQSVQLGDGCIDTLKDAVFALLDASETFPKAKMQLRGALAAMLEPGA